MIHRHSRSGQKLDVAGLNEITVIIDRSETELTEVGLNAWSPGLDGPPHAHDQKEQNFLVTAGRGNVRIGDATYPASPGTFFHVPARIVHQTINRSPDARLEYFLFNAFLDASKEGHASFADHIEQVRETRRRQAATQSAAADPALAAARTTKPGKRVVLADCAGARTVLVSRAEAERCEAVLLQLGAGESARDLGDGSKEQTCFVLAGSGRCLVGREPAALATGEVLFVPRGTSFEVTADADGLRLVSFGTVVSR